MNPHCYAITGPIKANVKRVIWPWLLLEGAERIVKCSSVRQGCH